jgi:YHS domain-containing protein
MSFDTVVTLALFAGSLVLMMRLGGFGFHGLGHSHAHRGVGSDGARASATATQSLVADRDVDPVCGMTVDKASAKTAVHEGQVYYFCSQNCREKFEAAPASYAKAAAPASHGAGHRHGCC